MGKSIPNFFFFNGISFNAFDSRSYYQSMIDTIVEANPGIKGPTGYQIGNAYLEEEVQELEVYIMLNGLYMNEQSCVMVGIIKIESISSISWFIIIEA